MQYGTYEFIANSSKENRWILYKVCQLSSCMLESGVFMAPSPRIRPDHKRHQVHMHVYMYWLSLAASVPFSALTSSTWYQTPDRQPHWGATGRQLDQSRSKASNPGPRSMPGGCACHTRAPRRLCAWFLRPSQTLDGRLSGCDWRAPAPGQAGRLPLGVGPVTGQPTWLSVTMAVNV